jgi:hemin uptake protein HemP
MSTKPANAARTSNGQPVAPLGPRRIFSTALFRDDREVAIIHRGQEYRLRITKGDKLILTK